MQMSGNTILITGGGSGIGTSAGGGLSCSRQPGDHCRPPAAGAGRNHRRQSRHEVGDIRYRERRRDPQLCGPVGQDYPALDAVIHNAGIMRPEDLKSGGLADAEAIITTNLLGPMRLTAALLPHLLAKPQATIMTVSSGLAFVPMALTPSYCATKAAIHSYTHLCAINSRTLRWRSWS